VRRLLLAAALALAFHSLLFTLRFEGLGEKPILPPRPLTLSLAHSPTEPAPALAVSKTPEPPAPLPPRPQVTGEKPQESRKPEKSSKKIEPSALPSKEQATPTTEGQGFVSEEASGAATPQESPLPAQAALGGGGQELPPVRVHEATPLYRRNPVPEYPLIARKRGYQGTVVLEVLVNREGKVKELTLSASSGYSVLDQAALTGVKTWLFDPGTRGGEKVDMWVKVPVRFQLE
jgi:protein TonB